MTAMYVIKAAEPYERQWTIGVAIDKAVAEKFVAEQQALFQRRVELREAFNAQKKQFVPTTPDPYSPDLEPQLETIPSWGPGRSQASITPEMRAERAAIKARNEAAWRAVEARREPLRAARTAEIETEENRIWESLGVSVEERAIIENMGWDVSYYIVEAPLIEG